MSFAALAWAAKQRPGNLAAKMVLLGLANYADEHGCAYPSTASLAEFGDMDHKTATAALDRLVELKLIVDSGDREGRTKQIKVYRLSLESQPEAEAFQKRKPSEKVAKAPQKRGTDTVRTKLPSGDKSPSGKRARNFPAPDGVSDEQWAGFVQHRRDHKKGGPLNKRAYTILCNKLQTFAEHGWPPGDMIDRAIDHGWITVFEPTGQDNGSPKFQRSGSQGNRQPDGFIAALREVQDRAADYPPT